MAVSMANAAGCVLVRHGDVDVTWQAYKTAEKIGVSGNFTSVTYQGISDESENFRGLLVGSKVIIQTKSANTGEASRDSKITQYFFGLISPDNIQGQIIDIKAQKTKKGEPKQGVVTIELAMNSMTKTVPMEYSYSNGRFSAQGKIDLADFNALEALSSINDKCRYLHKGKTWQDVDIGFGMNIKATLCSQ